MHPCTFTVILMNIGKPGRIYKAVYVPKCQREVMTQMFYRNVGAHRKKLIYIYIAILAKLNKLKMIVYRIIKNYY